MENKGQNLEEKLSILVKHAKKRWGCNASAGRVNNCIQHSNDHIEIYYGSNNERLSFSDSVPRINRGEYILVNDDYSPKIMMVYSPELKYQFTYKVHKYHDQSFSGLSEISVNGGHN
jgi:hypothetical protein